MIILTKVNGDKIVINKNSIAIIEPSEDNTSKIFLSFNGYYQSFITVKENFYDILDMLKKIKTK